MKKFLLFTFSMGIIAFAMAQTTPKEKTETKDSKTKLKPETTLGDKAHNVIHPNNKHSHGAKWKHKDRAGKERLEVKKDR